MDNNEVLLGRREILTDADEINESNVIEELTNALVIHRQNRNDIQYLWNYYRGRQDIQDKVKEIRPEINEKITVNRANEIVSFKVGYLTGEPITYISKTDDKTVRENVNKLNDAMYALGKQAEDRELVLWDMICGTAYRYISTEKSGEFPFTLYTLDPRNTFVAYSSNIKRVPKFSVSYYMKAGTTVKAPMVGANQYQAEVYEIYTDYKYFKIEDGKIVESKDHYLGMIPVIEYPANKERQGSFEIVLPLLNALNALYSNRMDSVEQFVQSFMKFVNCAIDDEDLSKLKDYGAIKIKSEPGLPADVELVSQELNQDQTQTFVDSIDAQINVICGLPNRNGGLSTSDTGRATELRDGWVNAETKAKDSEMAYKKADKNALRVIFNICKANGYCDLEVKNVDSKFTRRNYDNMQSKSQVLIAMLQNPKIAPILAFEYCGMFTDPEEAYQLSMEYYEEMQKMMQEQMMANTANQAGSNNAQGSAKNAKNTDTKEISNPIMKSATQNQ